MGSMYSQSNDRKLNSPDSDETILSVDAINVAFSGFLNDYNILNELHKITSPTLVIAGRHDWIAPQSFLKKLLKLFLMLS